MKRNSKGVLGAVTVMGAFMAAAPGSNATPSLPETSGMQPRAEVSDAALDVVKTKAIDARLAARKKPVSHTREGVFDCGGGGFAKKEGITNFSSFDCPGGGGFAKKEGIMQRRNRH